MITYSKRRKRLKAKRKLFLTGYQSGYLQKGYDRKSEWSPKRLFRNKF